MVEKEEIIELIKSYSAMNKKERNFYAICYYKK